eukprot:jgi/Mesvir1/3748/Mv15023-RA.1
MAAGDADRGNGDEAEEIVVDSDHGALEMEHDDNEDLVDTPETRATLRDMYIEAHALPCHVHAIRIEGNDRTHPEVIEREFDVCMESQTLDELREALYVAQAGVMDLEIFDACDVRIDTGPEGVEGALDLVVTVKEKNIYNMNIGTYFQGEGSEGQMEGSLKLQNPFGRAEKIEASGEWGSNHSNTFSVGYIQPRFLSGGLGELRGFISHSNYERHSSYSEGLKGVSARLSWPEHSIRYEIAARRIQPSLFASRPVLRQGGHSFGDVLSYTYEVDTWDMSEGPAQGVLLRSTSEIAGLLPQLSLSRFLRQKLELIAGIPLSPEHGLGLVLGANAGLILPWALGPLAPRQPVSIADRFFLGGPGSLRGFRTKGVGPMARREYRQEGGSALPSGPAAEAATGSAATTPTLDEMRDRVGQDAIGGDLSLGAFAALTYTPAGLPALLRSWNVHTHAFVNVGTLLPLPAGASLPSCLQTSPAQWRVRSSLRSFAESFRASVGVGIVVPTRFGALELNLCQPLRYQQQDRPKRGLQLGLGFRTF